MRLKSLTLKGFKSFPDRTRLDFGPGVSVVVGPNGSGKSNVTDAVLWAMGEQSPLAVRGQSMQDVIFGGGRGVQPRSAAEVEIVLDNSDGGVELPFAEVSIVRRLDRNGEGSYSLNGARARLTDVIEVLSDTGLGKESHSVISQGRVDSIVTSKPRERRLLIEEAAGLGKHRKRRRRAQLKLERTQDNLDRALDVEREARTRLRPLKRQAEAAQLHERLELQTLQARLALAREDARVRRGELTRAEERAGAARGARGALEQRLAEIVERRGAAERALGERAERHDARAQAAYGARSAAERLGIRAEQVTATAQTLERRIARLEAELRTYDGDAEHLTDGPPGDSDGDGVSARIASLEAELAKLEAERLSRLEHESAELRAEHEQAAGLLADAEQAALAAREARADAEQRLDRAEAARADAELAAQRSRGEAERLGAELAAVNEYLSAHARAGAEHGGTALGEALRVQDGYELALAAALGGRLDAVLVDDIAGADAVLDSIGADGGSALISGAGADVAPAPPGDWPPAPAQRLLDLVSGPDAEMSLARRLLADAWVVEDLRSLPSRFAGVAVTREGRVWFARAGEVRQLSAGGSERALARRNERDRLQAAAEETQQTQRAAVAAREDADSEAGEAVELATAAQAALHDAERALVQAAEAHRRTGWVLEQRSHAPVPGSLAVRIAEIEGELAAERRALELRDHERRLRGEHVRQLRAQLASDRASAPLADRLSRALDAAGASVREHVETFAAALEEDRRDGERMAAELGSCAAAESEVQVELRAAGEAVTAEEVAAQRARDHAAEAELELTGVLERLGEGDGEASGADPEPLGEEEADALRARVERLGRRREQLGPVNPLAQDEYAEAQARVQELEEQRSDLEAALRELRGVIRDTDRQIEETFEHTFAAASRNFEELVGDVFPGGSGRLRLVQEERAPEPVLGGEKLADGDGDSAEAAADAEEQEADVPREERELPGVEIEITPAGKATKRLSLLSGGEKSMTALAFLFAVFLARPCPFYILDEVEAALDDLNLDRFLALLRRYADRAQFIVITHQKRTMEAADWLYGVSMGADGVSKVLSRRLPPAAQDAEPIAQVA